MSTERILASEIRDVAQSKTGDPLKLVDDLIRELGSKRWAEVSDQIGRQWLAGQIRAAQHRSKVAGTPAPGRARKDSPD